MKGMIFTALIDYATQQIGVEACESLLEKCDLAEGGSYTAVGAYDPAEAVRIVVSLAEVQGVTPSDVLIDFGRGLFTMLAQRHPEFLASIRDPWTLLERLDGEIHVEVRKLYPDAELPKFDCERLGPGEMRVIYRSSRGLADLAEGLLRGCFAHFDVAVEIERTAIDGAPGAAERFELRAVS